MLTNRLCPVCHRLEGECVCDDARLRQVIRSRDTDIEELTGLRSEDAAEIARLKADIVAQQGCLLRWRAEALAARKLLYWSFGHEPGWIYDGSATREDHENYSVIRRENGGE